MTRTCMECGGDMPTRKPGKPGRKPSKFCHRACSRSFHQRRSNRGGIIYDLAMDMRKNRTAGAFGNLCHQISLFLQQDAADGRQSFLNYSGQPIPYVIPHADPMTPRKDANDG